MDHLKNELGRFSPREAVLSDGAWSLEGLPEFLRERLDCRCENGGEARFRYEAALPPGAKAVPHRAGRPARRRTRPAVQCAGGLLSYLYETQKTDLSHIAALTYYTAGQFMELDLTARQTLELTETLRGKEKKGSLLWVLDKTTHRHGAAADPGLDGAAPPLPGADQPPAAGGERSGGGHHHPGGGQCSA